VSSNVKNYKYDNLTKAEKVSSKVVAKFKAIQASTADGIPSPKPQPLDRNSYFKMLIEDGKLEAEIFSVSDFFLFLQIFA